MAENIEFVVIFIVYVVSAITLCVETYSEFENGWCYRDKETKRTLSHRAAYLFCFMPGVNTLLAVGAIHHYTMNVLGVSFGRPGSGKFYARRKRRDIQ